MVRVVVWDVPDLSNFVKDLMGRVEFSRDEISVMEAELNRTGVEMPQFRQLGGMLADQGGGNRRNITRYIIIILIIYYYHLFLSPGPLGKS